MTSRKCKRHQRVGCQICLDDVRTSSKDDATMMNILFYSAILSDDDMNTSHDHTDTSSGTYDSGSSDTSSYDSGSSDGGSYDSGSGGFDGGSF